MTERGAQKVNRIFKRMETDAEFIKRVTVMHHGGVPLRWTNNIIPSGDKLDHAIWEAFKAQRRIIDDWS